MPIQVRGQHHARIKTLVAQAKANDPERTWTSALLAEYVNEHYGGGITFKTTYYPTKKGNLKTWLTSNNLVDDDAKVGSRYDAPVYGVTDLADASMSDLTQPLYEDPHDPEKLTGWAGVGQALAEANAAASAAQVCASVRYSPRQQGLQALCWRPRHPHWLEPQPLCAVAALRLCRE